MNTNTQTTFYVVRHGETDWNKNKIIQGHSDIPLNQIGEKQAQELAKKLTSIKFDLAFSSDLLRAKRTTEIIALEHNLAIQTTELIRERNFGTFQGQPAKSMDTHLELLKKLSDQERSKHKIDESIENDEEFTAKILTFFRETALAYPGKTILVGAHGGVLRFLLIHLGALTYEKSDEVAFKNTAYLKLESDGVDFFVKEIVGMEKRDVYSKGEI
jgi:broad specificity phosphatase PhoE